MQRHIPRNTVALEATTCSATKARGKYGKLRRALAEPSASPPEPAPDDGAAVSGVLPVSMARAAPEHARTQPGRRYQPGPLLRWLYRRFFSKIHIDAEFESTVRRAADSGTVVYVLRSLSFLDYACLNFLTGKIGLPAVRFVNDLGQLPFRSLWRWLKYRLGRREPEMAQLEAVVEAEGSPLLFLTRPPHRWKAAPRGLAFPVDHIAALVGLQRTSERSILLVPQTFIWGKQPEKRGRSVGDAIFGPQEWPGRIRMALQFLFNFRNAILRVSPPLDLKDFVAANHTEPNAVIASKVRFALLKRLERERRVILGPPRRSVERVRDEIMHLPAVKQRLADVAKIQKKPLAVMEKRARKIIHEIEARMNHTVLVLTGRLFDQVWNRIFAGLEIDPEGLQRVREASRKGPLVLLPSHKSHVDYLVLSGVFYDNDLAAPHIAAGINLSFFPLGPILRRCGAFFLRRTFQGDALYATIFKAYVQNLLAHQTTLEFFVEGTRSRTGKLLPPKQGLLGMVFDAACELPRLRPQLVPVSITYSRIIEERSYLQELSGAEKKPEGLGSLLRTPKVLSARYGRVHINFGEVIDLGVFVASRGFDPQTGAEAKRRDLVAKLAHQIVWRIDQATVVTVSALLAAALLSSTRRGMERERLLDVLGRLCRHLEAAGARFASVVREPSGALRLDSVDEGMALLAKAGLVSVFGSGDDAIYQVPPQRRLALDYYKNTMLHHFVPAALVATAALGQGSEPLDEDTLALRVKELSRLFKHEFMFRADASFEEIFRTTLDRLVERGALVDAGGGMLRPGSDDLPLFATQLANFFEGYRLAARALGIALGRTVGKRELVRRTLALGDRLFLAGGIERAEALSKPVIESAFAAFVDMGVLAGPRDRGPYRLTAEYETADALSAFEDRIAQYLRS